MREFLIILILKWLHGITDQQWNDTLAWVRKANQEMEGLSGTAKRNRLVQMLQTYAPQLKSAAINLLIELAVSYAKRKP